MEGKWVNILAINWFYLMIELSYKEPLLGFYLFLRLFLFYFCGNVLWNILFASRQRHRHLSTQASTDNNSQCRHS